MYGKSSRRARFPGSSNCGGSSGSRPRLGPPFGHDRSSRPARAPLPRTCHKTYTNRCFAADDVAVRFTQRSRHTIRGKSGNRSQLGDDFVVARRRWSQHLKNCRRFLRSREFGIVDHAVRVAPTRWLSRPGIGERYARIKRDQHRRETEQEKPERDLRKSFG